MDESILKTIKKMLGDHEDDTYYDLDIIVHINSTLMALRQMGIGPIKGFVVKDENTLWSDFIPDVDLILYEAVKTYIYLKVKMLFDPPSSSELIKSMNNQIREYEWRLTEAAELEGNQNG